MSSTTVIMMRDGRSGSKFRRNGRTGLELKSRTVAEPEEADTRRSRLTPPTPPQTLSHPAQVPHSFLNAPTDVHLLPDAVNNDKGPLDDHHPASLTTRVNGYAILLSHVAITTYGLSPPAPCDTTIFLIHASGSPRA